MFWPFQLVQDLSNRFPLGRCSVIGSWGMQMWSNIFSSILAIRLVLRRGHSSWWEKNAMTYTIFEPSQVSYKYIVYNCTCFYLYTSGQLTQHQLKGTLNYFEHRFGTKVYRNRPRWVAPKFSQKMNFSRTPSFSLAKKAPEKSVCWENLSLWKTRDLGWSIFWGGCRRFLTLNLC